MSFQIRAISFGEIIEYISDERWKRASRLPITPERARSQQLNPNAGTEDTCLWVAESENGQVLGFAGSLPGFDALNKAKMGWNTCWWVDPDGGRDAAMPLFYKFLHHWDLHVAFADMSSHTHSIISQLGFCHTRKETLYLAYLRLPASKIISKMGLAGKILSPFIGLVSFLGNHVLQPGLSRFVRNKKLDQWESVRDLTEEIFTFIKQNRKDDFVQRSMEEYQWIEANPWLLANSTSADRVDDNYPFSYYVNDYRLEWIVSYNKDEISSVLLISVRDGLLKVLSCFTTSSVNAAGALAGYVSNNRDVYGLIFAHPDLAEHLGFFRKFSLKIRTEARWVGISKKILDHFPEEMIIQLGDGDSVFT